MGKTLVDRISDNEYSCFEKNDGEIIIAIRKQSSMNQEPDKREEPSFQDFVIERHPDPDHLMGKSTLDAWNEICKLAEEYRGKRKGSHKKIMLVWDGVHENREGRVVELSDQAVIYIDGERDISPPSHEKVEESDYRKFILMVNECLNDGMPIEKDDPIHNVAKQLLGENSL